MGLQSMTGFARAGAELKDSVFGWEVRSVNGKAVDARFRLPPGFERIEQPARLAVQKRFARGNMQATLTLAHVGPQTAAVVNEPFLEELAALSRRLVDQFGVRPASADGLLALRGVLEPPEILESEEERAASDSVILSALDAALAALEQARRSEGAALGAVLTGHLDRIAALTEAAEADPSREPAVIRQRLADQVRLLLDGGSGLDEARIAMEAALLATKADVREELDRLKTHIASARALLAAGGPVGRKLDFLSQEFNRESNTLCSKSTAASLTTIGLELKAVVDQFREQVQNLE
jgi:uncharacterized protein (TIGR00255 family)